MSATALPITTSRFATALTTLPISSLYAKHAELTNQITHLLASNAQLEAFARENDDRECYEAVLENREVVKRFEERREAIVKEVVGRGLVWCPQGEDEKGRADAAATEQQQNEAEVRDGEGTRDAGDEGVFL